MKHREAYLMRVQLGTSEIAILGTAHVSKVSVQHVIQQIESGEYDTIMIEVCSQRYQSLTDPDALANLDLWKLIKQRKAIGVMVTLVLQSYQQRLADQLGIEAGAEIKAAIERARKYDIPLVLIDRDIGITMQRLFRAIPWWEKIPLFSSILISIFSLPKVTVAEVEALKASDHLSEMFSDMGFGGRRIKRVLVDERDEYMAVKISQAVAEHHPSKAFVVVGAGHLPGIKQQLEHEIEAPEIRLKQLNVVPPRSLFPKVFPWLVVAIILFGFGVGFSRSPELGLELVAYWVVVNGGLSALGALIAGAHWVSVVAAFVAAPLTSLNPTIGAGMVTALVELTMRKPKVLDFRELRYAVRTWSGWRHNRVARTLLVLFFSTLGSLIGTYWAGAYILKSLW